MTLRIDLPAETEQRLRQEATRRGEAVPVVAADLIARSLPDATPADAPPPRQQSLTELFAEWAAEDATDDPVELARRQEDFEEFKRGMNAHSTRGYPIYP